MQVLILLRFTNLPDFCKGLRKFIRLDLGSGSILPFKKVHMIKAPFKH